MLQILSRAGSPIEIDACTGELQRAGFARACVEIDLMKPLVSGTMVGPLNSQFFQEFVYEGIGLYCYRCGKVGHHIAS